MGLLRFTPTDQIRFAVNGSSTSGPNELDLSVVSQALEYHLLLARDLKLIKADDYTQATERVVEIKRMLSGLIQKLNADR